ncbi:MAG: DPP IV N-terminal domain-containing protein, partial [Pirellulaceae bacterium]
MSRYTRSFPQHLLKLLLLAIPFIFYGHSQALSQGRLYKASIRPHWSADQQSLWYRNDLANGQREFILVDLRTGKRQLAFDHDALAAALTKSGLNGVQATKLPLDELWFDLPNDSVTLRTRGKHFRYQWKLNRLEKVDAPPTRKNPKGSGKPDSSKRPQAYRPSRQVSPDGKWTAYIDKHNLFVRDADGDIIHQLSKDGTASRSYQAPYWGPDSSHLVAFRVQPGDRHQVHLIETSPKAAGRAKLTSRRYPLPGDRFTTHELNWFDVENQQQVKPPVGIIDFHSPRLRWTVDGQHFRYQKIDRGHQRLRVIEVDIFTGKHRDIIDEVSETFIWTAHARDLGVPLVSWLSRTEEIVYLSEQDGWRHLYLVDIATGKTKHQITQGKYVVRYVDRIDEQKRQIWFRGSGRHPDQDPYLLHYYRVNFDGSGLTALTDGNGSHSIQYSPDGSYLIDTYSRVDSAPVHELRNVSDGKLVCLLEKADTSEMEAAGWKPPEVFSAKGRDGTTDIWGMVFRPRNFDPKKQYPVLEHMYAGPHDSYVPKTFSPGNRYASWTDLGFVVVKMDGMGTANRSKAFHD